MKAFFYSIILCAIFCTSANAQLKDERDVLAAVEKLNRAMVEGKREMLESIAAQQLSYGHSGGKIEDKAAFVEAIASGKSDFVTIDLTDQTVQVSGNTAIVRHILSAKTNDGGNPGSVNLRILLVWQKQKGEWKLLARQAVKIV